MAELFTTFESVSPPEIIPPDVEQNYKEIQLMGQPEFKPETPLMKEELFRNADQYLIKPVLKQTKEEFESSSLSKDIVNTARQFIGTKYSWGGNTPTTGFDCSGLMKYIFKSVGINLPRTAMQQGKTGQEVNMQDARPGDVIWFGSKNSPSGQHIGLISKIDNGQIYIIDAAGKNRGVVERLLPNLPIKSIRRLIGGGFGNNNFSQYALNFFKNKGLSDIHARGIVGNLLQESNGNHKAINSKSGAYGIAQWLGSRKQKLFSRFGKNPTVQQQLQFVWEELNSSENKAFQKLLNTNSTSEAARAFANHFERAGKNEMNMSKRIQNAYRA